MIFARWIRLFENPLFAAKLHRPVRASSTPAGLRTALDASQKVGNVEGEAVSTNTDSSNDLRIFIRDTSEIYASGS